MTYDHGLQFADIERDAWRRGDYTVAELAAEAQDRSEEVTCLEENVSDLEKRIEEMERERDDSAKALREVIEGDLDSLFDLINNGARVSKREEMLALMKRITEALP